MSYEKFKLTEDAVNANGVASAPDKLTGTAQENKRIFDRLIRDTVRGLFNSLVEQVGTDIGKLDGGDGGISPEVASALELEKSATLNEALQRLRNIAASGGIPTAEFVSVSKETAEAFALESDTNVDAVLQAINGEIEAVEESVEKNKPSGVNLLDNWYFADPIDSRGGYVVPPNTPCFTDTELTTPAPTPQTGGYRKVAEIADTYCKFISGSKYYYAAADAAIRGYTKLGYTIDRWRIAHDSATVTISERGVTITDTVKDYICFAQNVENFAQLAGKTVSFSALVSAIEGEHTILLDVTDNTADRIRITFTTPGVHTVTCVLPENMTKLVTFIGSRTTGETITVKAAKLELGSTQTLARQDENGNWVLNDAPPNKQMETLKCCMSKADSTDEYANGNDYTSLGMTRIVTGSYVGTGTYGESNPCSLTFDFVPKMVIMLGYTTNTGAYTAIFGGSISGTYNLTVMTPILGENESFTTKTGFCKGLSGSTSGYGHYGRITDGGRKYEWYVKKAGEDASSEQCNASGYTYYYMAIG